MSLRMIAEFLKKCACTSKTSFAFLVGLTHTLVKRVTWAGQILNSADALVDPSHHQGPDKGEGNFGEKKE